MQEGAQDVSGKGIGKCAEAEGVEPGVQRVNGGYRWQGRGTGTGRHVREHVLGALGRGDAPEQEPRGGGRFVVGVAFGAPAVLIGGVVEFDDDRKAVMASNLMVVLCGESEAQPVLNTGSLYQ